MVIVKASKESEAGAPPDTKSKLFAEMGAFNEELVKAGIMVAGDGLNASKFGKRVHFAGTKRTVTDGPFAETKELIAGYWVWKVKSMDEAIEWVKRCPNPHHERTATSRSKTSAGVLRRRGAGRALASRKSSQLLLRQPSGARAFVVAHRRVIEVRDPQRRSRRSAA